MKILKLIKTIFKSKKYFVIKSKKIFFFSNETFELFQIVLKKNKLLYMIVSLKNLPKSFDQIIYQISIQD